MGLGNVDAAIAVTLDTPVQEHCGVGETLEGIICGECGVEFIEEGLA